MAKRETRGDLAFGPEKAGAGEAPHHRKTTTDGQATYSY